MTVRPLSVLAVILVAFSTAFAQTSVSIAYDYAPISFPGAPVTNVAGINNSNVIVGSYFDSQDMVHGFIYQKGKYTAVNFPGATETKVLGINDAGDIVGMYQLSGNLNFHGFLRHGGEFTSLNDPAATFGTMATGINNAGTIVGSYDNAHGFVYNGSYRTLDAPQLAGEPPQTQLNGINNSGSIVGQVFTAGIWRAFWEVNGKIHFMEPAGSTDSEATGINGRSDIVGCHDSQSGFASFLAGTYPNSLAIYPTEQSVVSCTAGINYARVVVGNYSALNSQYGFLAVPHLTLQVSNPISSPLAIGTMQIVASASGINPVSQMQVWLNGKKIYYIKGGTLNTSLKLPAGKNQRLVIQAIDVKGVITKITRTISVP